MELMVLLIPPTKRALLIRKAVVRWVDHASFGLELGKPGKARMTERKRSGDQELIPRSLLTH
jgi:hypothetical protein